MTESDEITKQCAKIRLVKINVEGAELQAFRGALGMMERTESITYESWGQTRDDLNNPVDELLIPAAFRLEHIDGNNNYAVKASKLNEHEPL